MRTFAKSFCGLGLVLWGFLAIFNMFTEPDGYTIAGCIIIASYAGIGLYYILESEEVSKAKNAESQAQAIAARARELMQ